MKVHLTAIHFLNGIVHTLNEHTVGRTGRHVAVDAGKLLQRILLLSLRRGASFLALTLVAVDGI